MGLYGVVSILVRVDLRVMAMKEYSTSPKAPGPKSHQQI